MHRDQEHALESAAIDLRYAAGQIEKTARYLRQGQTAMAADSMRRACDAMDRVSGALDRGEVVEVLAS